MVLVIGLDGATFDLLDPWMAQGRLPTLAKLAAAGSRASLQSTLPPVTAAAWASFMTGLHPAGHGVFDFFRGRAGRYTLVDGACVRTATLWELLSQAGKRVGVLGVPLTDPPRPVNGYLVPGLLSPNPARNTHPPGLLAPYEADLGRYRVAPSVSYRPGQESAFIAELAAVAEVQGQYALRLARDHQVDFMMVHFLVTDIAMHGLWRHLDPQHPWHDPAEAALYGDAVPALFERLDAIVEDLLRLLPTDTAVVIMSDHGFGPVHHTVSLNMALLDAGLLALKPGRTVGARRRLWALAPKAGARVARLLGRERLLDYDDVDWTRTTAYAMGHMGQVHLNLIGREPKGIVSPDASESALAAVATCLANLRDEVSGNPLVVGTHAALAAGDGRFRREGPDLHVVLADGYACHPLFAASGKVVSEQRHFNSGDHRRDGVLVAAGPGIRTGASVGGARLVDLAPTLLRLLDVAPPVGMDGRLLDELFTGDHRATPEDSSPSPATASPEDGLSSEDRAIVEAQLRSLGYLR